MIDKRLFKLVEFKPIALIVFFRLLQLICSIGIWLIVSTALAQLIQHRILLHPWLDLVGIGLFYLAKSLLNRLTEVQTYDASAALRLDLREQVLQKAIRLGRNKEQLPATTLTQLSVDGIDQLEIYYGRFLPQLFYCIFASLLLFFVLVFFAWQPALVLFLGIPLIPLTIMMVMKIAKKVLARYWGRYTNLGQKFYENLEGFSVIAAFNLEDEKEKEMVDAAEKFREITMKLLSMQLNSITIMDLISYGGAGLGIGVALKTYAGGNLSLAGMIVFILLSAEVFIPMRQLGSLFHVAMNGISATGRLLDYLAQPEALHGKETLTAPLAEVACRALSFGYEKDRVLEDISLTLVKGKFQAFVGESGSGKSTLAQVLLGNLHGYEGTLTWNEKKIDTLTDEAIRQKAILVDEQAYLYATTIKDNLLLAKPNATTEELWEVLEKTGLKAEVLQMPGQLEMKLQENGTNLSGGQHQRVLIAQALLRDADFYVFDEVTSGVDLTSEKLILQTIQRLAKEKLVLFVSHRLYNVENADQIYVIAAGKIVQAGNAEKLRQEKGFYQQYFMMEEKVLGGGAHV
ncbi:ABC transporter ATP-binding protein/permease [Enterococcus hirae]|nr:ABC transporter ATP-binding protein/permease [Enterococcus hirae]